jgi:hypothetical protein
MTRVFITTKRWKALGMYENTNPIYSKINNDFSSLPKEYDLNNTNRVIILNDDFKEWENYSIQKRNDFILYHKESGEEVIKLIQETFLDDHIQNGSHMKDHFHDKVFSTLFSDNEVDKSTEILQILRFTKEQINEKVCFRSKLNLLHKCLSPETLQTITTSDLNELTDAEKNNFETFKSKVKGMTDPLGKEYIQFLTNLRTQFLSQKQ